MSIDAPSVSPPSDAGQDDAPLTWMLTVLREVILGVMAADVPPLKKANAITRLSSLYLKAYDMAELERVNAGLEEQVAEPEECAAAPGVEVASGAEAAAGQAVWRQEVSTATGKTGKTTPSSQPSGGTAGSGCARPNPRQKPAKPKSAGRAAAPRGRRK